MLNCWAATHMTAVHAWTQNTFNHNSCAWSVVKSTGVKVEPVSAVPTEGALEWLQGRRHEVTKVQPDSDCLRELCSCAAVPTLQVL